MDRNRVTRIIGRNVAEAIASAGESVRTVAHAADMDQQHLADCLNGLSEFEIEQLIRVGGVLHLPTTALLKEAAA